MDASKTQKLERCIRLTESNNDHEALSALRIAQKMCQSSGINFSDYLLKGKSSGANLSEFELRQLKAELKNYDKLKYEFGRLEREYASLKSQHHRLSSNYSGLEEAYKILQYAYKRETKSPKDSQSVILKNKLKSLKENYDALKKEQYYHLKRSKLIDLIFKGTEEEKEAEFVKMVHEFIVIKQISVLKYEWVSSTFLYNSFVEQCFNIPVISGKKFSQIFSSLLKLKPIKGGDSKNLMGFSIGIVNEA